MIGSLRSWLFGVTVASFAAGLIELLQIRMGMKKMMHIVTGLFLLSVIIAPLTDLKRADFSREFLLNSERSTVTDANETARAALDTVWRNTLATSVMQIAQEAGVSVSKVETEAEFGSDRCINIQSVVVYTSCDDPAMRAKFAALLESRLGCPSSVRWEEMNESEN